LSTLTATVLGANASVWGPVEILQPDMHLEPSKNGMQRTLGAATDPSVRHKREI
jgi:hypothetical protein